MMRFKLHPLLLWAIPVLLLVPAQDLPAADGAETAVPFTTVAEVRALTGPASNVSRPLALTGFVTLVDAERNLIVFQDGTGAIAVHPEPAGISVRPGQRVNMKASAFAPYVIDCPAYPYHPAGQDIRSTFEAPDNQGYYRMERMRGWICPPVTGKYTFWISSDDSSDLWLSPGPDPALAQRIAFIPSGGWAARHEWTRYATQRSESMVLKAGERYYIEALQEQKLEDDHLAVAWQGPGIPQAIIDGTYLIPWHAFDGNAAARSDIGEEHGISREYWTNYCVGSVSPLTDGITPQGGIVVRGMTTSVIEDGVWPQPLTISPGQLLSADEVFRWVQGEGDVDFLSKDGNAASIEVGEGDRRLIVRLPDWRGELPPLSAKLRVTFRGVCEGGFDPDGNPIAGFVTAESQKDVSFSDQPKSSTQAAPASPIAPNAANPYAGYYLVHGVVTFNDRVLGKDCLFVQDNLAGIFVSQKDRVLTPWLRVGQYVFMGGGLLPGRPAPVLQPATFDILGQRSFPIPVMPRNEAGYQDAQWTQMEGVAAAVNPDGTIDVIGRHGTYRAWIGAADPHGLEKLLNSVIRLRGVMSLYLFGRPLLLVPSLSSVELVESAPALSEVAVPISSLSSSHSTWPHQVKVAGCLTYHEDRWFYLQDSSGSVRVSSLAESPTQLGNTIEVVGFPEADANGLKLVEATWRPVAGDAQINPKSVDLGALNPSLSGDLIRGEGTLLSQEIHGTSQVLQLQAGNHVFVAVLESSQGKMPSFETGSLLEVTGIPLALASAAPLSGLGAPGSTPFPVDRVLLRTPIDVVLLQNPPWWTWRKAALLVGILSAVLLGSLVRIQYMHRRMARQQAARLEFTREMLQNQESERRRIAASLHDSLGQGLLVIQNQAHRALQSTANDLPLRQRLEEISNTTLQALEEVREITHNLRPYQLDRLGLTQAIRAITRKVSENSSVMFASHVDDIDGLFDPESEIHIYRIVQEAINNVMKHAKATEATVVVKNVNSRLSISIRDNGCGLPASPMPTGAGFGLNGIQERTTIMGGSVKIDSSPSHGVNLQVEIPIPNHPHAIKN